MHQIPFIEKVFARHQILHVVSQAIM